MDQMGGFCSRSKSETLFFKEKKTKQNNQQRTTQMGDHKVHIICLTFVSIR